MSDIANLIAQTAMQYGFDPNTAKRVAQLESSLNPSAQNPNSSAGGLYQFIDSTWGQYGRGANKMDPQANADAGIRYLRDVSSHLGRSLGRQPEPWEVYLGHQQGMGGASKLLANPQALASSLVGRDAVRLNAGNPDTMTAADFASLWRAKFNKTPVPTGGGGAVASAPAVGGLADMYAGGFDGGFATPAVTLFTDQRRRRQEQEAEEEAARQTRLAALFA